MMKMSDVMRQVAFKAEVAEKDGVEFKRIELYYDVHKQTYQVEWTAKNLPLDKQVDIKL